MDFNRTTLIGALLVLTVLGNILVIDIANVSTPFKYQWWLFLILPEVGFLLDFVFAILLMPLKMLLDWLGA